jgi:phage shock protein C
MKRVYRSTTDKKIFGICGGIGEAYNIDPNVVRIIVVFLALVTGVFPMILTYIVARLLLPAADR